MMQPCLIHLRAISLVAERRPSFRTCASGLNPFEIPELLRHLHIPPELHATEIEPGEGTPRDTPVIRAFQRLLIINRCVSFCISAVGHHQIQGTEGGQKG